MVKIKVSDFEGPLDLLLSLIRKNKIDIMDIPIAEITRQYNAVISDWEFFDMEEASFYLEMATRLMAIKSKMLLPRETLELEEDPRLELAGQLRLYELYREIAATLEPEISESLLELSRDPEYHPEFVTKSLNPLSPRRLGRAIHRLLLGSERPDFREITVRPERYSIDVLKGEILSSLNRPATLKEIVGKTGDRERVITFFMAMLELYKTGEISFKDRGEKIELSRR